MKDIKNGSLKLSSKVHLLYHLFHGDKVSSMIDNLETNEIVDVQKFVWEKTVEFGLVSRGKHFDRKEITRKMTPTPIFQKQNGCTQPAYHCKGTECIEIHEECGRKKIKEHVDVMSESIWDYINKYV
ncbi:hypothetical protein JW960_13615 [candidate division KSB1 bacterium]|nr:hypothetical protein [candidate division KSB1 bacterium]